jgi:UDP-N-acetylglucosamine acyltransferase
MTRTDVQIDPRAIVHPGARLAAGVSIGPFSIIGEHVTIGEGTQVGPHVVIEGHTTIGRDNRIWQFASIGSDPQDKKYGGEPTTLEIGDRNTIREFCTFSTGTVQDEGYTRLGDDNWIMAYVHLAHDCRVGNRTILANNVQLAGHVRIDDWVILGGFTGVHQFVRIGAHSMSGGGTILRQDVPPYVMAEGNPAAARGINSEGLKRRGFTPEQIGAIREAYRTIYRANLTLAEAKVELARQAQTAPEVLPMLQFVDAATRGIVR